jgi:AraC-like DNA-binding protein
MRSATTSGLQAVPAAHATAARSAHVDAARVIELMGARAQTRIPTATLQHLGEWLGWPAWLRDGTSIAQESGPLPAMLTRADDIRIMANIVEKADFFALVEGMLTRPRPALSLAGELAVLHGPDLGAAVKAVARGLAARNLWVHVEIAEHGPDVEIAIRPVGPMGDLFRAFALSALTLIHRSVASYRGARLEGMRLATRWHSLPAAQGALAAFGCAVVPALRAEALRFPRAWLDQPNPYFDPLVWDVAQAKLAALENAVAGESAIDPLREYIAAQLGEAHRVPRLKQAAAHLGLSTRTIVRSLARQDTSFHKLVEEERKTRALALIADPALPLAEVALALGFSDTSSFGRSFRKWFDDTPGNLRNAAAREIGPPPEPAQRRRA